METKPTSEEYAAACAVVKRMQEIVMEKFLLTLKGHEKEETVIIGMPEIGPDVVKFQTLLSPPFKDEEHPFFKSGFSHERSFPTAWFDMSNEDIQKVLQEEERIEKEKDLRLNEERLAMVLETGIKIETEGELAKKIVFDDGYLNADTLYHIDAATFNWHLVYIKDYARRMKKTNNVEPKRLSELKRKYQWA